MTTTPSTDVVPAGAYDTGLEDFDTSDMVMPRLVINHKEAKFVDSLSNEEFDSLDVVMLGLIKQRVLWDPEVSDDAHPLCKSYDFNLGIPDVRDYPWKASGFDKKDFEGDEDAVRLDCSGCKLKEWGSHPTRDVPWCSEQWVLPLLIPIGESGVAPAVLTLAHSGLKPAKAYLTSFKRANTGPFVAYTKMELVSNRRGTVDFAVPRFSRLGDTDVEQYAAFADQFRQIRGYLTTPRTRDDAEASSSSAPAAAPNPGASDEGDDGEIPF